MDVWDQIDPVDLVAFARFEAEQLPEQNQFILNEWLPTNQVADLEFRFDTITNERVRGMTPTRALDAEPRMADRRPTLPRKRGQFPAFGERMRVTEYEQLRFRANPNDALVNQVYDDVRQHVGRAVNRVEFSMARALFDAQLTFDFGGAATTVDFQRDAAMDVAAGVTWNIEANATPLDDIEAWVEAYREQNGFDPGSILMARTTLAQMRRTQEVRDATEYVRAPAVVTTADAAELLSERALPPIRLYDTTITNRAGVAERLMPAGTIMLMPPQGVRSGEFTWGQTLEATELAGLTASEAPGIVVVAQYQEFTPIGLYTTLTAMGMPLVGAPDHFMRATVL